MPHGLRVYRCLRDHGFSEHCASAIADIVSEAYGRDARYEQESLLDRLCEDGGIPFTLAQTVEEALRNCFPFQHFEIAFRRNALKTGLVRGGWKADCAEAFLIALEPAVRTRLDGEIRAPIPRSPSPGRVVMCDFTFLMRPEMQKERRAIVVSSRGKNDPGRCTVVPVSMTP